MSPPGGVCSGGCLVHQGCLVPGGAWSWGCLVQGRRSAPGGSALGGICSRGRGCFLRGCLVPGGSAPRAVCSRGSALGGGGVVSQHALRQTPPVNRMTDRRKNITFATSLRTVMKQQQNQKFILAQGMR